VINSITNGVKKTVISNQLFIRGPPWQKILISPLFRTECIEAGACVVGNERIKIYGKIIYHKDNHKCTKTIKGKYLIFCVST
jgi:hypothetical protein